MKWFLSLVLALAACQDEKPQQRAPKMEPGGPAPTGVVDTKNTTVISLPKAKVTDAYRADITTLCDVMRLSGAEDKPKDERWQVIAIWLGPQIKTSEGHEFLVAIQPLKGEAKALALETEAKRVGLTTCALANEWRSEG